MTENTTTSPGDTKAALPPPDCSAVGFTYSQGVAAGAMRVMQFAYQDVLSSLLLDGKDRLSEAQFVELLAEMQKARDGMRVVVETMWPLIEPNTNLSNAPAMKGGADE